MGRVPQWTTPNLSSLRSVGNTFGSSLESPLRRRGCADHADDGEGCQTAQRSMVKEDGWGGA